ncbi:MAG: hypothetical protein IRZ04_06870 [Rhodospirillales bacterium]|nr:hypothetical protein [Rhodospirillales bacterium]
MVLELFVLAAALLGLAAVVAEILVKSPEALSEMARDSERFARPVCRVEKAPVPANDSSPRLAA